MRDRTLLVDRAVGFGQEKRTKTRRNRTVRLVAPLARDLAELRLASGRPADDRLLFARAGAGPWRDHDYRNWRRRHFRPAAIAAGAPADSIPYDLRHSFVSLLLHEGVPLAQIAREAGHSVQTCASTYAQVMDELDPTERVPAETAIRRARENPSLRVFCAGGQEAGP